MNKLSNSFEFRLANQYDVDELYDLLNNLNNEVKLFFHPHKFDKNNLINICSSKQDHYFVMSLNDKIIGYSMLRLFGYSIPSYGCCIHPEYNGKGYGEKLTRLTLKKAKKLGFKVISENKETKEINMAITLI